MSKGILRHALRTAASMVVAMHASSAADIIPKPVSLDMLEGIFEMDEGTSIVFEKGSADAESAAHYLASVLSPATGYALPVAAAENVDGTEKAIVLSIIDEEGVLGREGYRLRVERDQVQIDAPYGAGLFYGIQTLRQLFPVEIFSASRIDNVAWTIPCVAVEDSPRFQWRGMCLDVARHFMPKEFVKKYIDAIALHKMNSLHLHLTDDQGWRIEIKKYPRLTEVGAWRDETVAGHVRDVPRTFDGKRHGGFYSQSDMREIVAYAAARHVNIVPEIEMPGHAQAAIAAYPELGNVSEKLDVWTIWGVNKNIFNAEENTILFLQDVLEEVVDLFPSTYIHVGGDEAVKDQWEASAAVQERMKTLGLQDESEMQSYIIRRMDSFLTGKGRRLVGWDEILEGGLAEGATVMSWRGDEGGIAAAKAGHDVVMAPTSHTYFDYYQDDPKNEPLAIGGHLPLEDVYAFNPVPEALTAEEARHILGTQGQLWTEYIESPDHAEYMSFPRACALAEVAWTPQDDRAYGDFLARLEAHLKRLNRLGINYKALGR